MKTSVFAAEELQTAERLKMLSEEEEAEAVTDGVKLQSCDHHSVRGSFLQDGDALLMS